MSDMTKWTTLGTQVQRDANLQKDRVMQEVENREKVNIIRALDDRRRHDRAISALESLKQVCTDIADAYNNGIVDAALRLTVVGGKLERFSVVRGIGPVSIVFEAHPGEIRSQLAHPTYTSSNFSQRFRVDEEGKLKNDDEMAFLAAEEIAGSAIGRLVKS